MTKQTTNTFNDCSSPPSSILVLFASCTIILSEHTLPLSGFTCLCGSTSNDSSLWCDAYFFPKEHV